MTEKLDVLHHVHDRRTAVYGVGDSPVDDIEITAWRDGDGADDTPAWGNDVLHVQINHNPETVTTGLVVHLNDGPPVYQGDPEQHSDAATVLRDVMKALNGPDIDGEWRRLRALQIIKRSGVIL